MKSALAHTILSRAVAKLWPKVRVQAIEREVTASLEIGRLQPFQCNGMVENTYQATGEAVAVRSARPYAYILVVEHPASWLVGN
jgi:hypothetical protein